MAADHGEFDGMELADAVEAVRDGLMSAARRGEAEDSDLRFVVGGIDMEFTVELRRDRTGTGGLKAYVVEAGGELAKGSTHTHRVALTLMAKDRRTGEGWTVGGRRTGLPS